MFVSSVFISILINDAGNSTYEYSSLQIYKNKFNELKKYGENDSFPCYQLFKFINKTVVLHITQHFQMRMKLTIFLKISISRKKNSHRKLIFHILNKLYLCDLFLFIEAEKSKCSFQSHVKIYLQCIKYQYVSTPFLKFNA